MVRKTEADRAPHGFEDDGTPKAPYGLNIDGTPRKSNRGARPGQRGNRKSSSTTFDVPKIVTANKSDAQRKDMLIGLADMLVVTPLVAVSRAPFLAKRIGERQADALAGDALILDHFMPGIADGLIVLSQTKPRALSWLDGVEDKAPYLLLIQVGVGMAKAFAQNHMNPDPRMAEAARTMVTRRLADRMADIERAANEAGAQMNAQQEAAENAAASA